MVMMDATLDLKGKMGGGFGAALMRTFANGESFSSSTLKPCAAMATAYYPPAMPGAMEVVEVGKTVIY